MWKSTEVLNDQRLGLERPLDATAALSWGNHHSFLLMGYSEGLFVRCWQMLAFAPQVRGHSKWINLMLLPPQSLLASGVVLLMVNGAERNREFVADLEPKTPGFVRSGRDGRGLMSARK
jgi:hypothetical protein